MQIAPRKAALAAALAAAAFAISTVASAYDNRPASQAEREAVERAVRMQGYVRVDGVAIDDGNWAIRTAWDAAGTAWRLDLDPRSLVVVDRSPA